MVRIENPEYVIHDRYPLLKVALNGVETLISVEQKALLVAAGIVAVGEGTGLFAEYQGNRMLGFTNDEQVFALWQRFLDDCNSGRFKAGPIAI